MKRMRLLACLFIIVFIYSCSGNSGGPGGDGVRQGQNVVLSSDQLISHAAGSATTPLPSDQSQPTIAYDTSFNTANQGKYLIAWTDSQKVTADCGGSPCGTDILGATCTGSVSGGATSLSCGDPFPISTAAGNQSQPKVAFFKDTATPVNSKYLVVWTDGRAGYSQIYGQFLKPDGSPIGGNFTISEHGSVTVPNAISPPATITYTSTNQSDPDLIYDSVKKKFVVTWLDINSYDSSQIFIWHGSQCTNFQTYYYIALPNSDNNMIQSVEVDPGAGVDASTRKQVSEFVFRSTSGFVENPAGTLNASFGVQKNESKPKITFSAVTGDYFIAWSGMDHTVSFSASYILDSGCTPAIPCTCTYNPATYTDVDNDTTPRIKLRKDTGLGLVQDFSFGTIATSPALASDPNTNRALVSWEENTGGVSGFDIKGQLVDLSNFVNFGNTINISNWPLDATSAPGDQTAPSVSFDNVNQRYFVVFEDARNQSANISNIDIYGQFIDPQGNLSGGNSPVTTASGNQVAPAIAFGDTNFTDFLVAWKDGRTLTDSDIRGQLIQYSAGPQLVIEDGNGNPISSGSVDFGNVNVGAIKDVPFKICNFGNSQLTILSLNGVQTPTIPDLPYSFTVPSPVTISPGTCYDMNTRFAPTAAGSYAGNPANNFKTVINSDGGQVSIFFSGNGVGTQPLTVTTTSLPDASLGAPYTATLAAFGGVFPYSWSISSGSLPTGLTLNASTGVISGIPTISGSFSFTVQVTDNNTPVKNTATRNLTINVSLMAINNTGLKPWTQGIQYSSGTPETLTATGGVTPYTWSISSGSLPPGISLNSSTGALTGVPTTSGVFTFSVKVTDSSSPTKQSATKSFSITINPPLAILTTSLPAGAINAGYTQSINSSGGTSPLNWSISSGSLPPGLSIDTGTGVISGTTTASGTYTFGITVSDGPGSSASKSLTIQVNNLINIDTTTAAGATVGTAYTQTFKASGGSLPYIWGIVAGSAPDGLTLNVNTGVLSGIPTTSGTFAFAVQVTDNNGLTTSKVFSVTVSGSGLSLSITTTGLTPWTAGVGGYSQQFMATGGLTPYSWTVTGATALPAGLTLSSSGLLSGTPTTAGTTAIAVKVTDANGTPVSGTFSLTINPALAITTTVLAPGTPGSSYNQQLVLTGGTAPYSWGISSGTLPPGLTLDTVVGTIKGTPTTAGTYNFTVKVTDGPGAVANANLTIQVSPVLSITTTSLPDTFINNNSYSQTLLASGGRAPYSWSITSGVLPTGLQLDVNTGIISETPTTLGTFTFVAQVTDADQRTATGTFSIRIFNSTDLFIATNGLPGTFVNSSYNQTLTAVGGVAPYKWAVVGVVGGALPSGLTLDPNTGIISGKPTTSGTSSFIVQVTDSQGRSMSKTFSIFVVSASEVIITTSGSETVPQDKIKILKTGDLPQLPNNFVMVKAVRYEIDGAKPGGQVIVSLTFNSLSSDPVFYNVKNGSLAALNNCSSAADTDCIESVDLTNRKIVLRILDNGSLDADPTAGEIVDTFVTGYVSSGGGNVSNSNSGGGCSIGRKQSGPTQAADILVMLAPLFAIMALKIRRRKKK